MEWARKGNKMEETKEVNNIEQPTQEVEKTLNDYLKDPKIQSEFDKKLESARAKWEESWKAKAEAERNEAERLAKMTESEKQKELLEKANNARVEAESALNAYKLKEEAQKIAKEKNLDLDLLETIDFKRETAETIKTKIDVIDSTFKKAIENAVNSKLKQSAPINVVGGNTSNEQAYLEKKYGNSKYFNK